MAGVDRGCHAALANLHETVKQYDAAIATYQHVPNGTPLQLAIDIRKALNLVQLERVDQAQKMLEELARENPRELQPLDALGNIVRGQKRFSEAVDYYSRAIALIEKPEPKHWTYFYSRGTNYERLKRWPEAEADLLRALQLSPDQPLVLNYLGYSWIDQNRHLKQALAMIEKAARLKPEDGYIADSLGWACYRLGNFGEALRHIQRAVTLQPEDLVLSDHLGDVLWKLGKRVEARAKWEKALTLNPEPPDAAKLRGKVAAGLQPSASMVVSVCLLKGPDGPLAARFPKASHTVNLAKYTVMGIVRRQRRPRLDALWDRIGAPAQKLPGGV